MSADMAADDAMNRIWQEWFEFYQRHFRGKNIAISAADQLAFYEIAQPVMRELAARASAVTSQETNSP